MPEPLEQHQGLFASQIKEFERDSRLNALAVGGRALEIYPQRAANRGEKGCLHSIFGTGVFSLGDEVEK